MPCEHNKEILIGGAASGEPLPLDLRTHLDSCPSCRATFDDERRLLAAIGPLLRATANAPVPPSLIPAVQLRLSQEDASRTGRSSSANWLYYAAAAASILIALLPLPRWSRNALKTAHKDASASVAFTEREQGLSAQPGLTAERSATPVESRLGRGRNSRVTTRASASSDRMKVLVPPDQELLLARYVRALHQSSLRLATDDSSKPPTLGSPIDVIEVSRVELLPLPSLGPDSVSESKQLGDTANGALK